MNNRAVIYARVSTQEQAEHGYSLPSQIEACQKYVQEQGWDLVGEPITDAGISGAVLERPGLERIRDMAEAGEINVVVVYEIDRLTRKLAHQLLIEDELEQAGVRVHYVLGQYKDDDEGRLMKQIRGSIAEYERTKIEARMRRGRRAKVKAGSVMTHGHPPWGYELEKADGKTQLAIFEEEAHVVRLIYQWYTSGEDTMAGPMSIGEITGRLTEMAIPTSADKNPRMAKKQARGVWGRSVVHAILTNETYRGIWHYAKRRRVGKGYVTNPREIWIPVAVTPIIDSETWELAQERLRENKALSRRNTKHPYLVARRIKCGRCGYRMSGATIVGQNSTYRYYRCPGRYVRDVARSCDQLTFNASQVDNAIWEWIGSFFLEPENLRAGLEARKDAKEEANRPLLDRLNLVEGQLAKHEQQMERLLDLYLAGDFPKETLLERKAHLGSTIASLRAQQAALKAQLTEVSLSEEDIATIEEFAERVRDSLDTAEFATKRRLVDLLNTHVILNLEDGQKVAYATCEVGRSMLIVSGTSCRDGPNRKPIVIAQRIIL